MHKLYIPRYSEAKFLAYIDNVSLQERGSEGFKSERIKFWQDKIPFSEGAKADVLMLPAPDRLVSYVGYVAVGLDQTETLGQIIPGVNLVLDPHPRYSEIPSREILLSGAGIEIPVFSTIPVDISDQYEAAS